MSLPLTFAEHFAADNLAICLLDRNLENEIHLHGIMDTRRQPRPTPVADEPRRRGLEGCALFVLTGISSARRTSSPIAYPEARACSQMVLP